MMAIQFLFWTGHHYPEFLPLMETWIVGDFTS